MDNKRASQIFQHLMGRKPNVVKKISEGLSVAEKFYVEVEGKKYFLKSTPEQLNMLNYKILKAMYDKGICVAAPVVWTKLKNENLLVFISDWIEGKNLEELLKEASPDETVKYAKQVAALLRSIHNFDIGYNKQPYSTYDEFSRYRFCLWHNHVKFMHKKEIYEFVLKRKHIWKKCTRKSLTHQDLRPENIIFSDGKPYLIDFETSKFKDPYSDLALSVSMQPDEFIPFTNALVEAYFNGRVPRIFWLWTCYYSVIALQCHEIWKSRSNSPAEWDQAKHLYDIYSGMTDIVPTFRKEYLNDIKSHKKGE